MSNIGDIERKTQNRVIKLFADELGYDYLGDWQDRDNNSNIEQTYLTAYLESKGYRPELISRGISQLKTTATTFPDKLYHTNKAVYEHLRYGVKVKADVGENFETVHLIDWEHPQENHFAVAEEVTIKGNKTKRPDVVIFVNGIALAVLELKRSKVSIGEGIRQNIVYQSDDFIMPFFSTVQYLFAGNDTEGLRYGTIDTPEKFYLTWKEDEEDTHRILLDKYLLKMCDKERFLEIIHDAVLFDAGIKKLPRVHQYFGLKESQKYVDNYEGGIIWHTQGSGKSILMVLLAKWILENKPNARIAIITDRDELDKQIERVFKDTDEKIYRTKSGKDLLKQLREPNPRLLCSLVHKFGKKDVDNFNQFIKELEENRPEVSGDLFVFVDECHRTQSGKMHRVMKTVLPNAVFIGFTGTPLLKKDKQTSLEVFGKYIHTYKFNEGVEDGVILDLTYEARDIDQRISSPKKIDEWFNAVSEPLSEYKTRVLKQKWGTMQKVTSSRPRINKIVQDVIIDFKIKPRLKSERGNALVIASSIYEACIFFELFQGTSLKGQCGLVTSYNPSTRDIVTEGTGDNTETEKEFIYNTYTELLDGKDSKDYEDWAKLKFVEEPANMKLLVVVDKLLTGFDAPSCTYLYIDKSMQDHGLFQAICRVNRLDTDDKEIGHIIDYKDLFKKMEDSVKVYTADLDYDEFDKDDIDILLQDRLKVARERLDNALEELFLLNESVEAPKGTLEHIHYYCGNPEDPEELKAHETQRTTLYKKTVALVRAFANLQEEMEDAGYSATEIAQIKKDVNHYLDLRDEIKNASGESIDLKAYEADMRFLIDTYITAEDSRKVSNMDDLPFLDIIMKLGLSDAIDTLPEGIKSRKEAIAETIENNVRSKIIKAHLTDPAYYDKMSILLGEIIKQRKSDALEYEEYLKKITELVKQVNTGMADDTPEELDTPAKRAIYNNLEQNEALAIELDTIVHRVKKADFRGNLAKEREIQAALYDKLKDVELVSKIFEIIKEQKEY
ncbi:MAG: HsdR family type I site-specific deoxyribonuclease [Bacteroidetes bacterium]|nr:HsdR family type I site-specific deoxyribonuclease [Bacteroidota bacterium]